MEKRLKTKGFADRQVNPTDPRAATMKILANAPSKSVSVAAIAQAPAHTTATHLLPHPLSFNY